MWPAIIAALGLWQSGQQAKAQQKVLKSGAAVSKETSNIQLDALKELSGIAKGYDPSKQTDTAVEYAGDVASKRLDTSLRSLRTMYGGGDPFGDSEFQVSAQRATNDALDPLKSFAANEKANEPMKQAAFWQAILGAPVGQISDGYFKAAGTMPVSDAGPSAIMLSQALQQLFAKKGGAGGSGDFLNTNPSSRPGDFSFGRNP